MQLSFKKINIESPTPTTQCGHISQTYLLDEYHDHLYARVFGIKDKDNLIIHVSFDLLSYKADKRNDLQDYLKTYYNNPNLHLITSSTHTHYANNPNDEVYAKWLQDTLKKEITTMEYQEYEDVTTSYQKIHTQVIGKSRISGYESNNEYLAIIKFFSKKEPFFNIVINNCHPTILKAETKFFSAEYPGYVLSKLEEKYPNQDFTFIQGAAGDISTRFTRDGQDYDALIKLSDKFLEVINRLMEEDTPQVPLKIDYHEVETSYEHDTGPIDLSRIRQDLTPREKETIEYGQIMRKRYSEKVSQEGIFSSLIQSVIVASLDLGSVKIIFFPNEIFSDYLNFINLDNKMLVSYSNGYGPYVLPIGFPYITYEMFLDTLTDDCKRKLIEIFKTI